MTITLVLSDIKITEMIVNYVDLYVHVTYQIIDGDGQVWKTNTATFWVNLPLIEGDLPTPDDWFQLPANYLPTFVDLRADAKTALIARFLTEAK